MIYNTNMNYDNLKGSSQNKLKALIWVISLYPHHARHAFQEMIDKGWTFTVEYWVADALKESNSLLKEVIALGDEYGRSRLLDIVRSFHPTYNDYISEPLRTVWGYPYEPEKWKP
jgi:hypothetical protein